MRRRTAIPWYCRAPRFTEANGVRSSALGCAVDARSSRRLGLEARRCDRLAAGLAQAVAVLAQLVEGVLDLGEGVPQLEGEGLGLAPLSRDLARIGEIGIVGESATVAEAQLSELIAQLGALLLQEGTVIDGGCIVGHRRSRLPPLGRTGARMSQVVGLPEAVGRDPRVDLGRGDGGVAEHLLDDPDVRPV